MRRLLLLTLLAASCGPARTVEILPRYAILTTVEPGTQSYRQVQWLADLRFARILRFTDIEREREQITAWLQEFDPTYVCIITRPEVLDANFQLSFLELACRLDADPFPDFVYGYLVAEDAVALKGLMATIQGAEAKVEKRLMRITAADLNAAESNNTVERLEWATAVGRRAVNVKAGDLEFLHKNIGDLAAADFLILSGEGSAEGITGLPDADLAKLNLNTSAVFTGADYTAVVGASYDATQELVRRRPIPVSRSFPLKLMKNGAAAVFAPIEKGHPGLPDFEWADAILGKEAIGWAMKHAYDLAIVRHAAGMPQFARLIEGQKAPEGRESPLYLSATRVLLGDPMLRPFERLTVGPLDQVDRFENYVDDRRVLTVRYRVTAPDCVPFFTDPFSEEQRVYLRIPLPPDAGGALANLVSCTLGNDAVYAKITAQAVEHWRGEPYAHVLLHGKHLAQKDLELKLSLAIQR